MTSITRCAVVLTIGASTCASACVSQLTPALSRALVTTPFLAATQSSDQSWPAPQWWESFHCTELTQLILTAENSNRDIAFAAQRVAEAEAQVRIQRSALFPSVNAQWQAARSGAGSGAVLTTGS